MPASLVPPFKQTFVDINGKPLVGGTVGMYVPATLTPANTWQDSAQTILNTNPITLDSRGQAIIYGVGSYRQILTDSLGNVVWDGEIDAFQESVFGPQDSIASATTTNLGSVASNNVLIGGTTTINSFGASASLANPIYFIQFGGALTLTYNATSMILPGSANITTAAGDGALAEFINVAGYWRVIAYFPAAAGTVFGTAASRNIGTSGANVPLLNGANVWSGTNIFNEGTSGIVRTIVLSAGTAVPDMATANNFVITTGGNLFLDNPVNKMAGQSGIIRVLQTAGGLTMTFGNQYKAPGGIAAVNLSGIINAIDYFAYYVSNPGTEIAITPLLNVS